MSMQLLLILHGWAAVLWVGGMACTQFILRPLVARHLPAEQGRCLMTAVVVRMLDVVAVLIAVLMLSGAGMMMAGVGGWHVHAMLALGLVMVAVYLALQLGPGRVLRRALADQDFTAAAAALARVRSLMLVNLLLGLSTIAVAMTGP